MAEPYRRPNSPYYWIDLMVDGKRVRRSTKRKTLKEARAVQTEELRKALDQSQFAGTPEITLREALFDHYLPASIKKKSYPQLVRHCKTLCGDREGAASLGGDTKFHMLNATTLRQYRSRRSAQGMSDQSIDHEMKCVSAAYNMIKAGYRVPAGITFPMARVKGKARYLTPAEEAALIEELEPCRLRGKNGSRYLMDPLAPVVRQRSDNYDLTIMLLDTGCRYGEIAHLTWSMVDIQDFSWVHIYREKVDNESRLTTTRRMREVLQRRWKERGNSHYVFKGWHRGDKADDDVPRQTTGAIRRAMAHIGINSPENVARFGRRDVRSLRDTFATKLRRGDPSKGIKGMSLDRLQTLLGHSTPQMTQKYADLGIDQASEEAVAALDLMGS